MLEKVVPIPFLGKEISGWLYRTTRWVREHPLKTTGILALCMGGSILYEAQVTHKNRMPSPNVRNHLEYNLRPEQSRLRRWLGLDPAASESSLPSADGAAGGMGGEEVLHETSELVSHQVSPQEMKEAQARVAIAKRNLDVARRLLAEETDPDKQAQLQNVIDKEDAIMRAGNDTTMIVRSGQLLVRNPHWDLRNSERNWSILSRDQQQQKDHYWYRLERSKDDDYARNTYSRP